jgi:DNA-3-methyladenine glycosylase
MGRRKTLTPDFFRRDTLIVAEDLLGMWLVRQVDGREEARRIVEVEAYDGPDDRASHASRGRTARNAPMFGEPGRWYAYLCYGMHWMLNVVTGPSGYPAAVLIRGLDGADGPGRVTARLGIDGRLNGEPIGRTSGVWIEDRGSRGGEEVVDRRPRIGVAYAGTWADRPYRFVLTRKDNQRKTNT